MKKTWHIALYLAGAALLFSPIYASAQASGSASKEGGSASKESKQQEETPQSMDVTVTGVNYCAGCALKKHGANAQCSIAGHIHALKVENAKDADGNDLEEMKGWTLHYLSNEKGKELRDERHGETVTLKGQVFVQERILDVGEISE